MKNNWNNIKKAADELGQNLDVSAAWERFEKREERKRRIFWLWPLIGLFTLVISLSLIFYMWDDSNSSVNTKATGSSEVITLSTKSNKLPIETHSLKTGQKNTLENTDSNNQTKNTNDNSVLNIENKVKLKTANYSSNKLIKGDEAKTENTYKTDNEKTKLKTKTITKPIQLPVTEKRTSLSTNMDLMIATLNPVKTKNFFLENNARPFLLPLAYLTKIDESYEKVNDNNNWLAGLSYTYGLPFRAINLIDKDFSSRRKENETFLNANNFNLSITRMITNQFSINAGVSLGHYRSKTFEVTQELESDVVFEDVIIERQLEAGTVLEIRDNVKGSRTLITERTRYQNYYNISIPVTLNYHIKIHKKFTTILSSGISCSIRQINQGVSFQSAFSVGEYETLNNLGYRKHGIIQGLLGLRLSYLWRKNIYLEAGLKTQFDLNNRLANQTIGTDKFRTYGLSLGLSKKI